MTINIRITFFIFFCSNCAYSQSIQRSTLFSSGGSYAVTSALQIQSNIGELSSNAYIGTSTILSQGFIQPETNIAMFIDENQTLQANVFPNPVNDYLYLEINSIPFSSIEIEVVDLIGQKLNMKINPSQQISRVDFSNVSPGIYFIHIISKEHKINKVFKINKI